MDGRTNFARLKKMLEDKAGKIFNLDELKMLIAMNIGSTPSTIDNALRTMGMTGLIKDIGNTRFEVL